MNALNAYDVMKKILIKTSFIALNLEKILTLMKWNQNVQFITNQNQNNLIINFKRNKRN